MEPHPGVVAIDDWNDFVAVDVPGLIEGAHEGKGLGDKFLKHLSRTRVILHMVDLSGVEGRDPLEDWGVLREELEKYDRSLASTPEIVAGNKVDLIDEEEVKGQKKRFAEKEIDLHPISVATGEGIDNLVNATYELLEKNKGEGPSVREEEDQSRSYKVYKFEGRKVSK